MPAASLALASLIWRRCAWSRSLMPLRSDTMRGLPPAALLTLPLAGDCVVAGAPTTAVLLLLLPRAGESGRAASRTGVLAPRACVCELDEMEPWSCDTLV